MHSKFGRTGVTATLNHKCAATAHQGFSQDHLEGSARAQKTSHVSFCVQLFERVWE